MNAAAPNDVRVSHNFAAEVNKALAFAGMTIADLAKKIVESEAFIRSVLEGEDDLDRLVNLRLMKKITDATGYEIRLRILLTPRAKRKSTVKGAGK